MQVKIKIHVVSGEAVNVALSASASGIIDSVHDLGGVKGLNDGFEPSSSSYTSNGAWHSWQGNQSGSAWVQYTWTEPVIITESDVYYFKDWAGNFLPSSVSYEYEDENGLWHDFDNVRGLGTEENKFNKTTFDPVLVQAMFHHGKPYQQLMMENQELIL